MKVLSKSEQDRIEKENKQIELEKKKIPYIQTEQKRKVKYINQCNAAFKKGLKSMDQAN